MPTLQCRICTKRYREFKIQVTPQLTPARRRRLPTCSKAFRIIYGGEWGPVTFPAFKAGDSSLRGWNGGFDFHAPPPNYSVLNRFKSMKECRVPRTYCVMFAELRPTTKRNREIRTPLVLFGCRPSPVQRSIAATATLQNSG